jgi:hypothetical protein
VVGDSLHGGGVEGLQHDRADAADEHRGVAVHTADGRVGLEPPRSRGAVDALPVAGAVGAGHLAEQLGAEAVTEGHVVEASQGPEALRDVTQPTFDFEYSKFLASMT